MTTEQLKEKYAMLYEYMAVSNKPAYMKAFGRVMNEMMDWMIANQPNAAEEWISRLESIKWNNYLTPKEAEKIVAGMEPKAPWTREQWKQAMEQNGYELEEWPCYNRCALYVTMNMIMSDSSESIKKYVTSDKLFAFVHSLALDKLKDRDQKFAIRSYFGL